MNIKRFVIIVLILLSLSTVIISITLKKPKDTKIDTVIVNDIVQSLVKQWGDFNTLPGIEYGMEYSILNEEGRFITSTKEGLSTNVLSAIKNGDTIVDIYSGSSYLGKLVIQNNSYDTMNEYRNHVIHYTFILLIIISVICIIYSIYLDKTIFNPFRKLQEFAQNVAQGSLNEPLLMDKDNKFGAFSESFDLMREELNKARESERKANQSKKELVASLSHDIKTPVASIKAVSELMNAKTQDVYLRKQLDIINSKADQINTLITNLFTATLEELQELKVNLKEEPSVKLNEIIRNADYNNKTRVEKIKECIVLADCMRLSQVVDNVISNSYKYASTNIEVTSQISDNYLFIFFKDYGKGVMKEEMPFIFNKYYRAENSYGKSGQGLGLYISKYLMVNMQGDIDCENREDGFTIILKLKLA